LISSLVSNIYSEIADQREKIIYEELTRKFKYIKCENKKCFRFSIIPLANSSIILTVLKGSVLTFMWSREARYDDEYLLELVAAEYDFVPQLLWTTQGFCPDTNVVQNADVNWNLLKSLQLQLNLQNIGVLSFTRILSKYLTTQPIFEAFTSYHQPMPLTLMYVSLHIQNLYII
jgi:hypothetical protein